MTNLSIYEDDYLLDDTSASGIETISKSLPHAVTVGSTVIIDGRPEFKELPKILCPNCGHELKQGKTTLAFKYAPAQQSEQSVDALVCDCGEAYVSGEVARTAYRRAMETTDVIAAQGLGSAQRRTTSPLTGGGRMPFFEEEHAFAKIEKSLDDVYAYEVYKRLWQELREDLKSAELREVLKERRTALKNSTGITDDAVLYELASLNFDGETVVALSLMPLAEVAWADGAVTELERKDVLSAAVSEGLGLESPGYKLLDSWLKSEPSKEFREAWQDYVRSLHVDLIVKQALKHEILRLARHVAKADGGVMGMGMVSDKQEEVLKAIEQAFD